MKLVSFRSARQSAPFTAWAHCTASMIVDLNMAYVRWLADQGEAQPHRLADAQVPSIMLDSWKEAHRPWQRRDARWIMSSRYRFFSPRPRRGNDLLSARHVRLAAPLPNPSSLRDFIAFEDHIAATSKKRGQPIPPEWYKAPVYYKGNHRTIIGPDEASAVAAEHSQAGLRTGACLRHRTEGTGHS